jgi:hypothetical protein
MFTGVAGVASAQAVTDFVTLIISVPLAKKAYAMIRQAEVEPSISGKR